MKILVLKKDITEMDVEAIVNPANSYLTMGGGVAGALRRKGGKEIEKEAIQHAPIKIGEAVLTGAGRLPARYVIHSPTMVHPAELTNIENVKSATIAALRCADAHKLKNIAFPGMGTGVGGVSKRKAALSMVSVIRDFSSKILEKVYLVALDEELFWEFNEQVKV